MSAQNIPRTTPAQMRALRMANRRASGCLYPLPISNHVAEKQLIDALQRRGWASPEGYITDAGRAIASAKATIRSTS